MPTSPTILLFAPRLHDATDYQAMLEARGWSVVRAASARSLAVLMKARTVDLVVLDDPPWDLARFAVTALDAMSEPVPRIWLSSLPEAPGHSAKLGVDALLLVPFDSALLVDHVSVLLHPRMASSSGSQPQFPLGSQPSLPATPIGLSPSPFPETTVGLRPRRQRTDGGGWDEESTGNWP